MTTVLTDLPQTPRAEETITAEPAVQAAYLTQLDGLRTLAFMMVFTHHLGLIPQTQETEAILSPINRVIGWNHIGLDIFFVLSGFLITRLLLLERKNRGNISLPRFYARRSLRIWPAYYAVLLTTCVLFPLLFPQEIFPRLYAAFVQANLIPMLLFLGNFSWMTQIPSLPTITMVIPHLTKVGFIVGPFWSLCVEEQFYLAWPLILTRLRSARSIFAGIAFLTCFSIACRSLFYHYSLTATWAAGPRFLYFVNTFCRLDGLMLGALIAMLSIFHCRLFALRPKTGAALTGVLLASFAYLCACVPLINQPACKIVNVIFYVSLGSALLLFLTLSYKPLRQIFSNKAMVQMGKLTYCMYLVHYGVIETLRPPVLQWMHGENTAGTWFVLAGCSLATTAAIAALSWKLLEGPCNSLRHRFARL